jgi:hypothetical protein
MKWKFWQSDYDRLDEPTGDLAAQPNPIPNPNDEVLPAIRGIGGLEIGDDVRALEGTADDPAKDEVFSDEIDPAWRDPNTTE